MKIRFFTLILVFSVIVSAFSEYGLFALDDSSRSDHTRVGPRGPTGPQGPTGPTGTSGSSGVSSAYGSFFVEGIIPLSPGQFIPFDSRAFSTSNVSLQPGPLVRLDQAGDYLVIFGASIALGSTAPIALTLNGTVVPGTNVSLTITAFQQLTTVAKTVRVATVPAALQVVNGSNAVTLGTSLIDIAAFITVEKINDLPIP
jgi:hypothetical protein